jgi:hypothetical protein
LDHYPTQLSGGEQQRVALARAFVNRPRILFADEPTGNLDQETGGRVIELMETLNREARTTLVLVTHDLTLAERAHRVVRLAAAAWSQTRGAGRRPERGAAGRRGEATVSWVRAAGGAGRPPASRSRSRAASCAPRHRIGVYMLSISLGVMALVAIRLQLRREPIVADRPVMLGANAPRLESAVPGHVLALVDSLEAAGHPLGAGDERRLHGAGAEKRAHAAARCGVDLATRSTARCARCLQALGRPGGRSAGRWRCSPCSTRASVTRSRSVVAVRVKGHSRGLMGDFEPRPRSVRVWIPRRLDAAGCSPSAASRSDRFLRSRRRRTRTIEERYRHVFDSAQVRFTTAEQSARRLRARSTT